MESDVQDQLTRAAIEYHRSPTPGNIVVSPALSSGTAVLGLGDVTAVGAAVMTQPGS